MPQFPLVKKPTYGVRSKIDRDNVLKCSGKLFGRFVRQGKFYNGKKRAETPWQLCRYFFILAPGDCETAGIRYGCMIVVHFCD